MKGVLANLSDLPHMTEGQNHMELDLQSLFWAPCAQLYSLAETPQPAPTLNRLIWAHIQGRSWSAKIDDISL
jgi:hypothetical protein